MNKKTIYAERLKKVLDAMSAEGLNGLIVSDPQSIWYLTGIFNEPYERLFVLYLDAGGHHKFFLNKLFNIHGSGFEEIWMTDTDDAAGILASQMTNSGKLGIDKVWPARFLIPLIQHNPRVSYVIGSSCVDDARACKDGEERDYMREASRINDAVMEKAAAFLSAGMTEKQLAEYIDARYREEGAEGPSFTTIVSFGKNAADPHHSPDDTVVRSGDCVLIDMGCIKNRYCSDMTRTYFFGTAPEEFTAIHDIVRSANEKAESIIKPGVRFCDIDAAARTVITDAGYGENFTHRLGHFIGQSDHEQGDVSSANTAVAKEGMIFSIEPGIYIPGRVGVRIEDLVLVTGCGCERLNKVEKHWKIIG